MVDERRVFDESNLRVRILLALVDMGGEATATDVMKRLETAGPTAVEAVPDRLTDLVGQALVERIEPSPSRWEVAEAAPALVAVYRITDAGRDEVAAG
jgi:hypothetical protein